METVVLILVATVALWWLFMRPHQQRREQSREAERAWAAGVRRDKQRKAAFAWESDRLAASVKLGASPPYEQRDLVSDFDLIAKGIAPDIVASLLEPELTAPAKAEGDTQVMVRYYDPQEVDDLVDADIYALCETWADEVVHRYQEAERAEKDRLAREQIEQEAERVTKFDAIKRRVDAAKAKLRNGNN